MIVTVNIKGRKVFKHIGPDRPAAPAGNVFMIARAAAAFAALIQAYFQPLINIAL